MLESLRIQDFRCHCDTTVRFGRLTALVGPNGSGKSSVLEVFRALSAVAADRQESLRIPMPCIRRSARRAQLCVSLHMVNEAPSSSDWVVVDERDHLRIRSEPEDQFDHLGLPTDGLSPNERGLLANVHEFMIEPALVGAPALLQDPDVSLDVTGANTAAVLAAIKIRDDAQFDRIGAMLRAVVPSIERLRVAPARIANQPAVGWEVHLDVRGVGTLPASTLSQGTRMTLALVTALCAPSPPSIALFDEIDHALHPRAQLELLRQLRALLDAFPALQIVFTTHSPYMLDGLTPDEVQVFALHGDGTARVRSLSEHPGASRAEGVLSAGELWSLSDEAEWVLAP